MLLACDSCCARGCELLRTCVDVRSKLEFPFRNLGLDSLSRIAFVSFWLQSAHLCSIVDRKTCTICNPRSCLQLIDARVMHFPSQIRRAGVFFQDVRDVLWRKSGERAKCPRCRGSGLLNLQSIWQRSSSNMPCLFCEGLVLNLIFS